MTMDPDSKPMDPMTSKTRDSDHNLNQIVRIILRTFLEHLVLFCIIFTFFVIDVNQSMIISHFRTQFDYFHFPPRNFV